MENAQRERNEMLINNNSRTTDPHSFYWSVCTVCARVGVAGSFEAERESRSTCHYFTDELITPYKLMLCVAEKEVKEKKTQKKGEKSRTL